MRATEAVDLINRTIFRPGWEISALLMSDMFRRLDMGYGIADSYSSQILVEFHVQGHDTSYPDRQGRYTKPMEINPNRPVDVSDMSELELLAWVKAQISLITEHEDLEYLRVRQPDGSWLAPFHPHRADRVAAWERARRHPEVRDVEARHAELATAGAE
jgi:hypothetical protein